jgi:hypothetical protein
VGQWAQTRQVVARVRRGQDQVSNACSAHMCLMTRDWISPSSCATTVSIDRLVQFFLTEKLREPHLVANYFRANQFDDNSIHIMYNIMARR